ncbi:MAG: hypothetical protein KIS87_15295 [Phycisphaeraceae bacterium]|nr:hypothetical protein [Phycisphaeraceae bacterium]
MRRTSFATAFLVAASALGDIHYPDFSNAHSTLALNGDAFIDAPDLVLVPDARDLAGSAWHIVPLSLAQGFKTTFTFDIDGSATDGIAFVIHYAGFDALGRHGSGIGYDGIPNSIAVEFDGWFNGADGNGDPSDNHISVHTRGTDPNSSDHAYSLGAITIDEFPWNRPDPVKVTILYIPGSLSVWIDDRSDPDLTVMIDVAQTLELGPSSTLIAGFTAATGSGHAHTAIAEWHLTVIPAPAGLGLFATCFAAFAGIRPGRRPTREPRSAG